MSIIFFDLFYLLGILVSASYGVKLTIRILLEVPTYATIAAIASTRCSIPSITFDLIVFFVVIAIHAIERNRAIFFSVCDCSGFSFFGGVISGV